MLPACTGAPKAADHESGSLSPDYVQQPCVKLAAWFANTAHHRVDSRPTHKHGMELSGNIHEDKNQAVPSRSRSLTCNSFFTGYPFYSGSCAACSALNSRQVVNRCRETDKRRSVKDEVDADHQSDEDGAGCRPTHQQDDTESDRHQT